VRLSEAADAGPHVAGAAAGRRCGSHGHDRGAWLSNAKAKIELEWQLRYPSWRNGFEEALA